MPLPCLSPLLVVRELVLVIAQLQQKAFAQRAAAYARRVELANHFEGFLEIGRCEVGLVDGAWSDGRRFGRGSSGCRGVSVASGKKGFDGEGSG